MNNRTIEIAKDANGDYHFAPHKRQFAGIEVIVATSAAITQVDALMLLFAKTKEDINKILSNYL